MRGATCSLVCGLAFVPATVWAGRPLVIDDAGTVPAGCFEFEAGLAYDSYPSAHHVETPLTLGYGLAPTLEFGVGAGCQFERRAMPLGGRHEDWGWGDLVLGAKWNPLPEARFFASHAVALALKLPTADADRGFGTGETDFDANYIASKSLGNRFTAHVNLGFTWTGDAANETFDDVLHGGLAVGYLATERLELVAEVYADVPLTDEANTAVMINGGARWTALDALVLDAAIGAGLRGDTPDWTATVGLTWLFGGRGKGRP